MCLTCGQSTPHKYCSLTCYRQRVPWQMPTPTLLAALNRGHSLEETARILAVSKATLIRRMHEAGIVRVTGSSRHAGGSYACVDRRNPRQLVFWRA